MASLGSSQRRTSISQDGNMQYVQAFLAGHLILTKVACRISGECVFGRLQAFKIIIIITVHGTSTIKLDFVCCLSSTHPFQEIFEIRLCHLSSKLTCLGHLAQHCLDLLPLFRFGQLDCVQSSPCFLVQYLAQDSVLHFLLLLLLPVTPSSLHGLHFCHPPLPDLCQFI